VSPLDRQHPPEPGALRDFSFPAVERRDLPGGLDLRVARVSRLPVVSAVLFLRAGESALEETRAGLACLAGDTLEGGTRRRSGSDLSEALERLGARLSVSTGWEGTSVSLSCLAERLGEALPLLVETVREPAFPEEEVARAREHALAVIRQRAMDPASQASEAAARRYFAPGVPYARPLGGTVASVEPLGRDHLSGYADAFYRPGGGGLVVVGDVDADEIEAMTSGLFRGWGGAPPATDGFEVEPAARARTLQVVDRPGSVQSEIRVGHVGIARSDPDVFAVTVLNTVLGGAFTSRLNLNLRERNGFTYGVRSRFFLRGRPGAFSVRTAVGTEVTAQAVREILTEIEGLVEGGPREGEVEAARDYIAGTFPLQQETVGQVAARVAELIVYGLEDDYHDRYRDRIRAVDVEATHRVARRHLRPAEAQIVVVGDGESVTSGLEALGLGAVEVTKPA
jgi:zinc protease